MNERENLMRRIQAAKFVAWELKIFLDTHPNDRTVLARLREEEARIEELCAEYEEKYGPIKENSEDRWGWINSPWPWETDEEEGGEA